MKNLEDLEYLWEGVLDIANDKEEYADLTIDELEDLWNWAAAFKEFLERHQALTDYPPELYEGLSWLVPEVNRLLDTVNLFMNPPVLASGRTVTEEEAKRCFSDLLKLRPQLEEVASHRMETVRGVCKKLLKADELSANTEKIDGADWRDIPRRFEWLYLGLNPTLELYAIDGALLNARFSIGQMDELESDIKIAMGDYKEGRECYPNIEDFILRLKADGREIPKFATEWLETCQYLDALDDHMNVIKVWKDWVGWDDSDRNKHSDMLLRTALRELNDAKVRLIDNERAKEFNDFAEAYSEVAGEVEEEWINKQKSKLKHHDPELQSMKEPTVFDHSQHSVDQVFNRLNRLNENWTSSIPLCDPLDSSIRTRLNEILQKENRWDLPTFEEQKLITEALGLKSTEVTESVDPDDIKRLSKLLSDEAGNPNTCEKKDIWKVMSFKKYYKRCAKWKKLGENRERKHEEFTCLFDNLNEGKIVNGAMANISAVAKFLLKTFPKLAKTVLGDDK